MKLTIKKQAKRTIYPDIEDNLSLPEEERFAIELEKPSNQRLQDVSVEFITGENGDVEQRVNTSAITRAFIKRLVNPPDLEIDGRIRKMKITDLFRFDEFADIMQQIDDAMGELRTEGDDPKN